MSYGSPTLSDSSYVILILAIGTLKRSVPQMVVFNAFPEKEQIELIAAGIQVIEGSLSSEAYIDKLEAVAKKLVDKSIKFDDYTKEQLKGRIALSKNPNPLNKSLEKKSNKITTHIGTMKSMSEAIVTEDKIVNKLNDPRFNALPGIDQDLIYLALWKWGHVDSFLATVTTPMLSFVIGRFKKNLNSFSPKLRQQVQTILITLDPTDQKKYKPEPIVQDFQLNSVELGEKSIVGAVKFLRSQEGQRKATQEKLKWFDSLPINDRKDLYNKSSNRKRDITFISDLDKVFIYDKFHKEPLTEAVDRTSEIMDTLTKNPGSSFTGILQALGVVPKSSQQIQVFTAMKKGLLSGTIRREKEGMSFKYFVGNGTPTVMATRNFTPKAKVAKIPASQIKKKLC